MLTILLLFILCILIGQLSVRFSAKVPLPVAVALKLLGTLALFQALVRVDDDRPLAADVLLRVMAISLGLWAGETFCPVCLTGSIATGKSTVASFLQNHNVYLVDADSIGHEILLPPRVLAAAAASQKSTERYTVQPSESVYERICEAFAEDKANFVDADSGLILRRQLGSVIFANDAKRRTLNRITHPKIIQILIHRLLVGLYVKRVRLCCADVPLLFESGLLRHLFCLVMVVATNADLQYQRLRQRNPDLSDEDCRNRIQSQYPVERKVAGADIVIWNNGTVAELQEKVETVQKQVRQRLRGGMSMSTVFFLASATLALFRLQQN